MFSCMWRRPVFLPFHLVVSIIVCLPFDLSFRYVKRGDARRRGQASAHFYITINLAEKKRERDPFSDISIRTSEAYHPAVLSAVPIPVLYRALLPLVADDLCRISKQRARRAHVAAYLLQIRQSWLLHFSA